MHSNQNNQYKPSVAMLPESKVSVLITSDPWVGCGTYSYWLSFVLSLMVCTSFYWAVLWQVTLLRKKSEAMYSCDYAHNYPVSEVW